MKRGNAAIPSPLGYFAEIHTTALSEFAKSAKAFLLNYNFCGMRKKFFIKDLKKIGQFKTQES